MCFVQFVGVGSCQLAKGLVLFFRATPAQNFLVLVWFASPDSIVGFCSFGVAGEVPEREFENLSTSHITIQSSRRAFGARLIEALCSQTKHREKYRIRIIR